MYHTLFSLAGVAMVGWALLIVLPAWRVTRLVAETVAFPVFLAVIYVVGIVAVLVEMGPGFMRDFGSADGVIGLLASGPIALVAWIHILAFDHLVGVLIYRDNMRHRFVPLPVQSVILFFTLMLGPVGFLSYWAVRSLKRRSPRLAASGADGASAAATGAPGTRAAAPPADAAPAPRFREVVKEGSPVAAVFALWRRERVLVGLGVLGFVLAGITTVVAAVNGGWLLEPEGRLLEAVKFDTAVGIYVLTLALMVPLAPFSARGRGRWVGWMVGLALFGYGMETVQAWRGLDPRFSQVAGPVDQILGGVFFLSALGLLVLFVILMSRFFRPGALPDHAPLRLALRYAAGGVLLAFGIGIVMSGVGGRVVGEGDLMPLHAAGFHALQAVPLAALLLGADAFARPGGRNWIHVAGWGWLLLCIGLGAQALAGWAPGRPTVFLGLSALGALAWVAVVVRAGSWRFAGEPVAT